MLLLLLYPQDDTRIARVTLRWAARQAVATTAARAGAARLQQRSAAAGLASRTARVQGLASRSAVVTMEMPT